jgi:putative membrane protein insertion efficiency factor
MSCTSLFARVQRIPQMALVTLVRGYRLLLSPWLGSACRFTPTCSAYALDALVLHGAVGGSYLTVVRLVRCHPWCVGGLDPVPARIGAPKLFTALLGQPAQSAPAISRPPPVSKTLL